MHPMLKNLLGLILGVVIGAIVNGGVIAISGSIIPPPEGTDLKTMEGLKAAMPLMQFKHFIMPFLAHALGTLVGAAIAVAIASSYQLVIALSIGTLFLVGGTQMVMVLPSPLWFNVLDLGFAYIPMAYLGWKLVGSR